MKTLWIMVGIPGSGKTYFAKHNLMQGPGWWYVSRDEIRYSLVKENEEYFSKETEVFEQFISKIKAGLDEEGIYNVIADATHLNTKSRQKLINALHRNNIQIIPVVMQTDLLNSLKQNDMRDGRAKVSHSAIRRMNAQLEDPVEDSFNYTAIMYVNNN